MMDAFRSKLLPRTCDTGYPLKRDPIRYEPVSKIFIRPLFFISRVSDPGNKVRAQLEGNRVTKDFRFVSLLAVIISV